MATLEAELVLNVSDALSQVDELASTIDAATEDVTLNVDVNVDEGAFDGLFDELDSLSETPVEVEAELADIEGLFDELDALSVDPVEVEVESSGVEETQQEVEDLGSTASTASDSMDGLGTSTAAFGAAAGAAGGSAEGLIGVIGGLGPAGAAAAGGIAAVAASSTALFTAAVQSTGSAERFNLVLGDFAAQVDSVELGDLTLTLEEFATMIGQDDEALRNSLSTLAAAGQAYGVAGDDAARYAEQLTLLAGRATVLKPSLEIGGTVDALSRVLATGGARLARFGLDIGTVAERTEIANELFGRGFEDLNRYEQSVVGAEAATRNLGSSLQRDIIAGSENVEVKLQSLQQSFANAFETIGEPLILPVFDLIEGAIPAGLALAEVFASLGRVLIPLATGYLSAIGPGLEIIADAFTELAIAVEGVDLAPFFEAFGRLAVSEAEAFAAAIELLAAALPLVNFDAIIFGLETLAFVIESSPLVGLAEILGETPKAVGGVSSAFSRLTEEEQAAATAAESFVAAAVGALPQLGDAIGNVNAAGEAFGVLEAASDPAVLAANLDAMTAAILEFQGNLSVLRQTGEDLDATLQFIAEAGPEEAGSLLANLVDGTEADRAALETSLEELEGATTGFEAFLSEEGAAGGASLATAAAEEISANAGSVTGAADAAATSAADSLGAGLALAYTGAQVAMSLATAAVVSGGVALISTAGTVGTQAGAALGRGFATSVSPGVQVGLSVARVQIAASGASLSISAASTGRSIGRSLGDGISQGIRSSIGQISQAARDAVNEAEAAARAAADSNSPSRLFAAVGSDMGEGLVLGFEEATAGLISAAEGITYAAAAGVTATGSSAAAGSTTVTAPTSVQVIVQGDATPENARLVRDGAREGVVLAQRQLFDVAAG